MGVGTDRVPGYLPDFGTTAGVFLAYCERLLKEYWPAVEAVAAALLRVQTLDETTLRAVAEQARGRAFPPPMPNPPCSECGARLVSGSGDMPGLPDLCGRCAFYRR